MSLNRDSNLSYKMDRQQLEISTQDSSYHGVNSEEVLQKFIVYQSICKDPLNIFRYMQEMAICTFLPTFWVAKAEVLAQLGDYNTCFECIDLAYSRTDEDQVQALQLIEQRQKALRKKLVDNMRQFPLKAKRSAAEFELSSDSDQLFSGKSKQADTLKIYQEKYKALRGEKQKNTLTKWQKLPKSWLHDKYLQQDQRQRIMEQKIHQNSMRFSRDVKYHSMHTPIRVKDPQRLTKTMDSVEILKKKRSTRQKSRNHNKQAYKEQDEENNLDSSSESKMMNSLPVGRKFNQVKRRVTFNAEKSVKIQKIRMQEPQPQSFEKIIPISSSRQEPSNKMEQQGLQELILSEPFSKK